MYFQILDIRDVVFRNIPTWAQDGVMAASPYRDDQGWHVVGRGFTAAEPVTFSHLFLADGTDPLEFTIRSEPLLSPGPPGCMDELGVEDPTVIGRPHFGRGVLYSQVRRKPPGETPSSEALGVYVSLGHLFQLEQRDDRWAAPEYHTPDTVLEPTEQRWWERPLDMCKEGEILLRKGEKNDVLFYEFADGERSRIAAAETGLGALGRILTWNSRLWLDRRPGMWDSDHVSTGPIVRLRDKRLMFYNGRSGERIWSIGEVIFDPATLAIEYRSEEPIIVPPKEIGWKNQYIAFSSGALVDGDTIYLYHHIADRRIRCAVGTLK
ncbi:MAG: hypothetical protein G01um101438_473 [Parcubacteria group bacterium Gr01-1014_38]|nr:MAG: hypothetical protein G01um101438_473 [Parcubacteria group bacterium Gr01-1014_38]